MRELRGKGQVFKSVLLAATLTVSAFQAEARPQRDLPLPSGKPTADAIIDQVYYLNHFYGFDNYSIENLGSKSVTVIVNRTEGNQPKTMTVTRHINNKYDDGKIRARDIAFFGSGKLKATGFLITDYEDESKTQSYMIYLPALRKIRRFAQPAHDDDWGGTVFTFGDVALRKPEHETHELLGEESFGHCSGFMNIPRNQRNRYTRDLPTSEPCDHKGKQVYKVKSTTKFENWWYDERISYVDTKTFGDYRTEYFKDGKMVKVIDRDWGELSAEFKDPRKLFWKSWYGKDLTTGKETWAYIPRDVVKFNTDKPSSYWSPRTLTKLKR